MPWDPYNALTLQKQMVVFSPPIWKKYAQVKLDHFARSGRGENSKHIWTHHLEIGGVKISSIPKSQARIWQTFCRSTSWFPLLSSLLTHFIQGLCLAKNHFGTLGDYWKALALEVQGLFFEWYFSKDSCLGRDLFHQWFQQTVLFDFQGRIIIQETHLSLDPPGFFTNLLSLSHVMNPPSTSSGYIKLQCWT